MEQQTGTQKMSILRAFTPLIIMVLFVFFQAVFYLAPLNEDNESREALSSALNGLDGLLFFWIIAVFIAIFGLTTAQGYIKSYGWSLYGVLLLVVSIIYPFVFPTITEFFAKLL